MSAVGRSRLKSWAASISFLLALILFGLSFGALAATRILATTEMGWDQIADFLGGALTGALAALIFGVIIVRRLSVKTRMRSAGVALLGTVAAAAYMTAQPPKIRPPSTAPLPPPAVQPFAFTLGTGDPLEGPRALDPLLPWNLLRIYSNLSVDFVLHDQPDELCVVADALQSDAGIAAANMLRDHLQDVPDEIVCEPPCATCTEISLGWQLDQRSRSLQIDDRCWHTADALRALRASVTSIVVGHARDNVVCERIGE